MLGPLVVAFAALLVAPAWTTGGSPELRLVRDVPLTVQGSGFDAQERVLLTLRSGRARAVRETARADARGRFRAAFDALVAVDPCRGTLSVTAAGSEGSRATWKRVCRPPSTRPPRVAG